jgi:hypothetical protein
MCRSALIATIWLGLPIQAAWSEDALPLTNVTINMINRGGRGGYRIEAKIANPTISRSSICTLIARSKTDEATT